MEKQIKVALIVATTSGKIVFDYFSKNKYVEIVKVITFPDDSTKPRHVCFPDLAYISKSGVANIHLDELKSLKPDLIIVEGWSELLNPELLTIPKMGTIGFHPSKLPLDRGRSVLAWQIEDGYEESAVTMFYYNKIPDGGDIIGQDFFKIEQNDYINDVLDKLDKSVENLLRSYFPLIRIGISPRNVQNINEGGFRRLRTEKDSQIDWNKNSVNIYNKIRAISTPYPLAKGVINSVELSILRSEILKSFPYGNDCKPGTLIATLFDDSLVIKTRDGFLRILEYNK
jgi:methionyl-tRNA formyltransferase